MAKKTFSPLVCRPKGFFIMQIYCSYSKEYHEERKKELIKNKEHFEEKIDYDYDEDDQIIEVYKIIVFEK